MSQWAPPHRPVLLKLPCDTATHLVYLTLTFRLEQTRRLERYLKGVRRPANEGWPYGRSVPHALPPSERPYDFSADLASFLLIDGYSPGLFCSEPFPT